MYTEVIGIFWLTYVFPVAALLFIALFFTACPAPSRANLNKTPSRSFTNRDVFSLCGIAVLYAVIAFYNLGDGKAPENFHIFSAGETVILDVGTESSVDDLFIYSGLNTGSFTVDISSDGITWENAAVFEQDHVAIFKWNTVALSESGSVSARFIRLTADSDMWVGELAVRSGGKALGLVSDARALIDEQELVPAYQTYLNSTYFDEIYHARTAFENINSIYPYEISHPPLGKLIIAIGIELFGMTPFGWRFSGTLFGVLMLPVLYAFLKKMFGGTAVPACGTAIFAFDFMHFTQTRIATIDTYAVFFIILMYMFMYLYISRNKLKYLALSGLFFGLGAASKWTCIYAGGGLAVIWLIHWIRHFDTKSFIKNCLFCLVFFVLVPCAVYYVSYFPYGQALGMHGPDMFFKKEYADIVINNQQFMLSYHSGVTSEHPYSSRWYQWIIDGRPILYYLQYYNDGTRSSFGAFLNPVLCWAGLASVIFCAYLALKHKDSVSGFIVIGYLAQLLPWVFIGRTTFEYHYFPAAVFLTAALCRVFSLMQNNVRRRWRYPIYGLTLLSVVLFIAFYPVLSGYRVDASLAGRLLQWLPSWPF